MVEALIGRPLSASSPMSRRPIQRIGLHPFASQPSKLWPAEHWQLLARELLGRGFELWAFSAPEERQALERVLAGMTDKIALRSTDIRQYCLDLSQLDLVIGLDSLCMHTAHRFKIPSLTINAGNPPELYAVSSGQTLGASGGCRHYPCYNIAPCRGTAYENACVKAISPQRVLDAVETLRASGEPRAARSAS
jgi:ADP-heptose:LPS heptosyltransferase